MIEKTLYKLVDIHTIDGLAHFFYGFFMFNILCLFTTQETSFWIVLVIAILKEVYDHFSPYHNADFLDVVYTIAPAVVQILISHIKQ